MLPDFPAIKSKLGKLSDALMKQAKSTYMGVLSESPENVVWEGHRIVLVREDGSVEQVRLRQISVQRQIDLTEVGSMTPETVRGTLESVAKEMAMQQSKILFEDLNEGIRKVGNLIDAGGRPFSIEDFFKAIDTILIDFDENENPLMPMIVAGDKISEAIAKVLRKAESDPNHRRRLQEIISRKRMEWRDREANRKLVG